MFLFVLRRQYILLTILLRTAEFFWKCSLLFWEDSSYCSHYCYVQLSFSENDYLFWGDSTYFSHYYYVTCFSENVQLFSEETVHTALITSTYRCAFLKMLLMYVLLTLLLRTVGFFWKYSLLFPGDSTPCSHYYYVQISFNKNIPCYSEETVQSAHITTMYRWFFWKCSYLFREGSTDCTRFYCVHFKFFWKCSYLFRGDCTFCSHYYLVKMSFSEMFWVILRVQFILLTLLLFTKYFFWKCTF